MKNTNSEMGRREFLAACGKMSCVGALSSVINMSLVNKVLAARAPNSITDYKGLVCVFLEGGCDSFNMLTPGIDGYANYAATRGTLALAQENLLHIEETLPGGSTRDYHINGNMTGTRDMFNEGDLSFVANIGTLVERMTLAQYLDKSKRKPLGLGSHFDQKVQWQTSVSNLRSGSLVGTGWVGRMTEILSDAANYNATVHYNMAPGGNNRLQTSIKSRPLALIGGAKGFDQYNNKAHIRAAIDGDVEQQYQAILQNHYNHIRKEAIEQNNALEGIELNTEINTVFPDTSLGAQLLQVAKYIKAQGTLQANRQTFFVKQGGFDMHRGVTTRLPGALSRVSEALTAFNSAMKEIGYHDKVVTYTASDFGRTISNNRDGSDHGWGGNNIVMGGPVSGKRVFTDEYPDLVVGAPQVIGRGRMLPTTSVDELHASLASWFGVNNDSEMEAILPNIRNFWDRDLTGTPIANMFS